MILLNLYVLKENGYSILSAIHSLQDLQSDAPAVENLSRLIIKEWPTAQTSASLRNLEINSDWSGSQLTVEIKSDGPLESLLQSYLQMLSEL